MLDSTIRLRDGSVVGRFDINNNGFRCRQSPEDGAWISRAGKPVSAKLIKTELGRLGIRAELVGDIVTTKVIKNGALVDGWEQQITITAMQVVDEEAESPRWVKAVTDAK